MAIKIKIAPCNHFDGKAFEEAHKQARSHPFLSLRLPKPNKHMNCKSSTRSRGPRAHLLDGTDGMTASRHLCLIRLRNTALYNDVPVRGDKWHYFTTEKVSSWPVFARPCHQRWTFYSPNSYHFITDKFVTANVQPLCPLPSSLHQLKDYSLSLCFIL